MYDPLTLYPQFSSQAWSASSKSLLWRYTAIPRGVMTVLATPRGYVGGRGCGCGLEGGIVGVA